MAKFERLPSPVQQVAAPKRSSGRLQAFLLAVHRLTLLALTAVAAYGIWTVIIHRHTTKTSSSTARKVPFEVHIVAKCPNARTALSELVLPAVERAHDKVDFRLSMLGKFPGNDEIECKHGPEECEASVVELCAQDVLPEPMASLGFVECVTSEYERLPDDALYRNCARKQSIDFEAINECAVRDDGDYGRELLRESIQHSIEVNESLNGTVRVISATVRLDEEIYCIRDFDEWTHCPHGASVDGLVEAIDRLYGTPSGEL